MNSQMGQGWSQRRRKGTNGEDVMEKDEEEKQGSGEKQRRAEW